MSDEEEDEIVEEKPKFVIVEFSQLELLLQRCMNRGKLPGGKNSGKERPITWTKRGTSLTAQTRCSCNNDTRIRWSTQTYISGTKTRTGNMVLAAAALVAPNGYPELSSFFYSAQIPFLRKVQFWRLSRHFVWPVVQNEYANQQQELFRELPSPLNIAIDGQFDSPGYSAELCAVTALEAATKQVIGFSVVHKSEVNNKSHAMELQGVKHCLDDLANKTNIHGITTDQHPQIVSYLQSKHYDLSFDPWHRLKSIKKDLRTLIRKYKDQNEKTLAKELGRRLILQIYSSIEKANGDVKMCQERIFSFFLHIQGIHSWNSDKYENLIVALPSTKVCARFRKETFEKFYQCEHSDLFISTHQSVQPSSPIFQDLLAVVAKTAFLNDVDKMRIDNVTLFVESFHSVCIKYRPKRKYFPKPGFILRTMLAALAFNKNRKAEMRGERGVVSVYRCFSKSKGSMTVKMKQAPGDEKWKIRIVDESLSAKQCFGPGLPSIGASEEDDEQQVDTLADLFGELLNLSDCGSDSEDV